MDSAVFLERGPKGEPRPLYVVHGDEDFLKRRVMAMLRLAVLGPDDDGGLSVHAGTTATYAGVFDDLQTAAFFSPRRLVQVDNADPFITRSRAQLEKVLPALSGPNVLVLDVKTWAANTRLAKLVPTESTLVCKAPAAARLSGWAVQWALATYAKQLTQAAAVLLVDLVGAEMGQLDQELLKLSIYVGERKRIDEKDVDRLVGRSREETIWQIFDAIGGGQSGGALKIMDRLFDQGEDAMRLLGAFSMTLRRLAQVYRLNQLGQPLGLAMENAGVVPFARRGVEQQIKHLGRRRLEKLYDWLLEIDQGLKGGNPLPPRTQLERLVVRLARRST